ncbi:MAG: FAD-binding protein, partial [Gemmobacter sp.]
WIEAFVTFADFDIAARYAMDLANEDGILKKLVTVMEAPTAKDYFQRVAPHVGAGDHILALMIAPHSSDAWEAHLAAYPGQIVYRSDRPLAWDREPGHVFEYTWNHTTLRALKVDPAVTYLQVAYPYPSFHETIAKVRAAFPGELLQHLEVMRYQGKCYFAGLSLVKFTTEARLDEIVQMHETMGAPIWNPHRYTLEEGGRQTVDDRQLAFKREADPKGLLNPGKMIAWDAPDFDYRGIYVYKGMRAAE